MDRVRRGEGIAAWPKRFGRWFNGTPSPFILWDWAGPYRRAVQLLCIGILIGLAQEAIAYADHKAIVIVYDGWWFAPVAFLRWAMYVVGWAYIALGLTLMARDVAMR